MPDNQAYKKFICDIAGVIVTGDPESPGPTFIRFYTDSRDDHRALEDIFYEELRCNLVHEAELKEVGFSQSWVEDSKVVGSLNVPTAGPAEIPDFWVMHLITAIRSARKMAIFGPLREGGAR